MDFKSLPAVPGMWLPPSPPSFGPCTFTTHAWQVGCWLSSGQAIRNKDVKTHPGVFRSLFIVTIQKEMISFLGFPPEHSPYPRDIRQVSWWQIIDTDQSSSTEVCVCACTTNVEVRGNLGHHSSGTFSLLFKTRSLMGLELGQVG